MITYSVTNQSAEIALNRAPVNAFSLSFLDEILGALRRALPEYAKIPGIYLGRFIRHLARIN